MFNFPKSWNRSFSSTVVNSISIYVSNDTQNVGASIQPRIWEFDESQPTLAQAIDTLPIGSTPFNTVISSSMLDSWLTLYIFPPASLYQDKQYIVGWEQMSGSANGNDFLAGRDRSMEPYVTPVTNFTFLNDASPSWGWVNQVAGVRLNSYGCSYTYSVKESVLESSFSLAPNPNNGQFTLRLENPNANTYQLKVRNSIGQILLDKSLSPDQVRNYKINLGEQQSGLYFVSLESEGKTWVEKIVVN